MVKFIAPSPVVFLVDDDVHILKALERILSSTSYLVQCYTSAEQFITVANLRQPGCVVLDMSMPGMPGSKLQEYLLRSDCLLPVIFLTGTGDVISSVKAMKLGAADFLTKPVDAAQLLAAVELAVTLNKQRLTDRALLDSIQSRLDSLTNRERQVMDLVVSGRLNKQTAYELGTVEHTVKLHRASVMKKMQADSLSDLVTTINIYEMLQSRSLT